MDLVGRIARAWVRNMLSKPTVVLLLGACHTPHHFVDLIAYLLQAGYPVSCTQLASVDPPDPHACHMSKDIMAVQQQILQPLIDKGRDILLVAHSIAGYAGGAAALGLSKKEGTAAGKRGGILSVVFIAAFLSHRDAKPLLKLTNGSWPPDFTVDVRNHVAVGYACMSASRPQCSIRSHGLCEMWQKTLQACMQLTYGSITL